MGYWKSMLKIFKSEEPKLGIFTEHDDRPTYEELERNFILQTNARRHYSEKCIDLEKKLKRETELRKAAEFMASIKVGNDVPLAPLSIDIKHHNGKNYVVEPNARRNCDPVVEYTTDAFQILEQASMVDVKVQPLKDTGKRQDFDTGAQRDNKDGKGAFHLIPYEPIFRLALTFQKGSKKYKPRNWELGMPLSQFVDSGYRHLMRWMNGERDEDHLAQCLWNISCLIQGIEWIRVGKWPAHLNDIPNNEIVLAIQHRDPNGLYNK